MKFRELGYISNLLSLARIVLAVPIYYLLSLDTETGNYLAVFVMFLAGLTDLYDGRLARKLKQQTDLGRVLDPVADKICMGIIAFMLVKTKGMPMWFLGLVIGRDLAIVLLGLLLSFKTKQVVESNMIGKITVNGLALTVIAYTLGWESSREIFLWLTVALLAVSSVSYLMKFQRSNPSKV